jgi:hypothetical protein
MKKDLLENVRFIEYFIDLVRYSLFYFFAEMSQQC